ncbi:hypothetical protein K435DRAFT_859361 [Dendrothele bispora CBS 962.96]|uniref:Uncharacterized protein n=1 Tax=Dendrothele bispora (strain CBS 962.96) TaxID=1314807 RepID=A0A4S8M1H5_DENBC|nr:hypothetical protein K435DRAFT_859361 [Dendrothele bispora CBS 962.96]
MVKNSKKRKAEDLEGWDNFDTSTATHFSMSDDMRRLNQFMEVDSDHYSSDLGQDDDADESVSANYDHNFDYFEDEDDFDPLDNDLATLPDFSYLETVGKDQKLNDLGLAQDEDVAMVRLIRKRNLNSVK